MARRKRDILASIRLKQRRRLAQLKKSGVIKRASALKAKAKTIKPMSAQQSPIHKEIAKPKPIKKPAAIKKPKPVKRPKPLNGTTKWEITPLKMSKMSVEELCEAYNRDELRKMARQYKVKGSAKVELAYEMIQVAKDLLK